MATKLQFKPDNGITAYSATGYQYLTTNDGSFNFLSPFFGKELTNKFWVDNCWETGNIWQIENSDGWKTLIKRTFSGDIIASVDFEGASVVSVVQPSVVMPSALENFSSDDLGAWVVDNIMNSVTRLNNNMEVVSILQNFVYPSLVVADVDGGCFVFDDGTKRIYKVTNETIITGYTTYLDVSSFLTTIDDISNVKVDIYGKLWIALKQEIVCLSVENGGFTYEFAIVPSGNPQDQSLMITDIDIDRGLIPNILYVIGGCPGESYLNKYNDSGQLLEATTLNVKFPVAVKVSQFPGSDIMYILEERNNTYFPIECESSSSSTSSIGYSSSSDSSFSSSSLSLTSESLSSISSNSLSTASSLSSYSTWSDSSISSSSSSSFGSSSSTSTGGDWFVEKVVDGSIPSLEQFYWPDVATDSNDFVHPVYYNASTDIIYKSSNASGSWVSESIDNSGRAHANYSQIDIDISDRSHIVHINMGNDELRYALYDSGWSYTVLDNTKTNRNGLAIATDSNGYPHVVAGDNTVGITYYYFNGSIWQNESITADRPYLYSQSLDIDIDSNDKPHICYATYGPSTPDGVYYVERTSGTWSSKIMVDDATNHGGDASPLWSYASIKLDSDNIPHISFRYQYGSFFTRQRVYYALYNGVTFDTTLLDTSGTSSGFAPPIIDLDANGNPRISSVLITSNYDFRYYYNNRGGWIKENAHGESAFGVGSPGGFTLDSKGNPHIVYSIDYDIYHLWNERIG